MEGLFFTIKSISAAYFCWKNYHSYSYFDSDMGTYTCTSIFYDEVALEYIVFLLTDIKMNYLPY